MQNYNTIIGVIQMRQNNCSSRSIMDRYRIGSGTVSLIVNRYVSSGLSLHQLQQMSPKDVENIFYPQKNLQRKEVPQPDFQAYYDRIHAPNSRKRQNPSTLTNMWLLSQPHYLSSDFTGFRMCSGRVSDHGRSSARKSLLLSSVCFGSSVSRYSK